MKSNKDKNDFHNCLHINFQKLENTNKKIKEIEDDHIDNYKIENVIGFGLKVFVGLTFVLSILLCWFVWCDKNEFLSY